MTCGQNACNGCLLGTLSRLSEWCHAHQQACRPLPASVPFYRQLYFQVVVAIVLGALLGHFEPAFAESLKPLGDAFIKLVKMIIAPVIFLTIVTGIAGMTHLKTVGRVFGKAMAYFLFFSTLALVVGLVVARGAARRRHEHQSGRSGPECGQELCREVA